MARIFIGWEMGGSLGHLARLPLIVAELVDRGHEVFLAPGQTKHLGDFPFPQSMVVLPVPYATCKEFKGKKRVCNATILLYRGYADTPTLAGLVRCWRGLYSLTKPDIFLFDYAPTAMLAARDLSTPKLNLSSGFGALVPGNGDMDLTPWLEGSRDEFRHQQDLVTTTVNEVCTLNGFTPVSHFSEIYRCDFSLMSIMPELDEYRRDPARTLYYTLFGEFGFPEERWRDDGRAKVFVYLKPDFAQTGVVLDILARGEYDALCYCPGISGEGAEGYRTKGLNVVARPISLSSLLPDGDLVICHASKGLVVESLLRGIPLLNLPTQVEQAQNARLVEELGAGLTVPPGSDPEAIASRLDELRLDPSYRQVAQLIGNRNLPASNEETLRELADRIETFLPKA